MAAGSAMLIVYRSGCDFMSMCLMEFVLGFTTHAPNAGFPFTCEPSVETKSLGFYLRLRCLVWSIVVFGSALGCWCRICYSLCLSHPVG